MAEVVAETARLRLRDWQEHDEAAFYEIMNRPEVMEHLGGLQTPEEWGQAYRRINGFQNEFGHTFWIVENKESGELLGFCGIKRVNAPGAGNLTGTHEIGWRFRPEAWGKGVAKESAIASLDLAFGRLRAPHVIAMTTAENLPSQGLMERLGMVRRNDLDFWDERFGEELNPAMIWRIEAADWPAARARALQPR